MQETQKLTGKLYLVATPIGNLEDITLRAVRILGEVDCVAAEDTRRSVVLLKHLGLSKPLISLNEHNEEARAQLLIGRLQEGQNIALVTDAGTPAVSDPGARLVRRCREAGITCVPIPGPSALVTAISASGADTERFCFEGFLPVKGAERKKRLAEMAALPHTLILYEAPHRLQKTLEDLLAQLGDREVVIARELTKVHEEIVSTTLQEAIEQFCEPRGEFVLIVQPGEQPQEDREGALVYMRELLEQGVRRKDAAAQVAEKFGISKNEAYSMEL